MGKKAYCKVIKKEEKEKAQITFCAKQAMSKNNKTFLLDKTEKQNIGGQNCLGV